MQAIEPADMRQERGNRAWSMRLKGEVARPHCDREGAIREFREAIEIGEALGMRPLLAQCHLAIGELLHSAARPTEARVSLERAAALAAEMGIRRPPSPAAHAEPRL